MDFEIRPKFTSCVILSKLPTTSLCLTILISKTYYFVDLISVPLYLENSNASVIGSFGSYCDYVKISKG